MTILEMSLGGGVLIAVILVLRRALLNRVPKWTFLLLWAAALCRLLIPFTVPSPVSVYNGAAWAVQAMEREEEEAPPPVTVRPPAAVPAPLPEADWTVPVTPSPLPAPEKAETVSPIVILYLTGAALCGLFFTAAYLWTLRRFWEAVPVEEPFIRRWREAHPTLFPIQIKVSRAVNAPLAYGLIHPVILLPEHTDWTDEDQLTCVLTHEYVHIRRGDLLWKLLLTAALCVHWFNPLVWAMYFRANRDLELACDERVVRILGLDSRKGYAYALLAAEESRFSPLCLTYTTKNHMEERIRAIMKIKKQSLAAILTAALLVTGVTAVFATSKAPPKEIDSLPKAVQTNPDPAPAPVDKSAADNRVHPVTPADTSTPEDNRVHPVTGQPGNTPVETPSQTDPKNRWNVPANPIPGETKIPVADKEDMGDLIAYLRLERGFTGRFSIVTDRATGSLAVRIGFGTENDYVPKDEVKIPEGLTADGHYPVNSKGETYGNAFGHEFLVYNPDLVAVRATNGKGGYALQRELDFGDYPGDTNTLEGFEEFLKWRETQPSPRLVKVYDVNRDNIIGYFEVGNGSSSSVVEGMDLETAREEIKNNRWGVPADPVPQGMRFPVADEAEMEELINFLCQYRDLTICDITRSHATYDDGTTGNWAVGISYQKNNVIAAPYQGGQNPEAAYPVNSRGETYGNAFDMDRLGYEPDLIAVKATNGKSGYMLWNDYEYFGYPRKTDTPEEFLAFIEWQNAQSFPITLPVYDVNRDNLIGYYEINLSDDEEFSEDELKWLEDGLRRAGIKEEDIAQELEKHKAPKD